MPLMKDVIRARRRAELAQTEEPWTILLFPRKPPEPEEETVEDEPSREPTKEPVVEEQVPTDVWLSSRRVVLAISALQEAAEVAIAPESSLPLHQAAETSDIETLKDLLAKVGGRENIDEHDPNFFDMTALMLAVEKEHTAIIAELLNQRADINAVQRPAHYEKQTVSVAAVKGLVFKQDAGKTPLMFAATIGSTQVITQLLDMMADVNRVSSGKTALDWALLCEKTAAADLLQEAGGMTREDVNIRAFCKAAGVDFGEEESEAADAQADVTTKAAQKFEEWDADYSGSISSDELEGIMVKLKAQFTRKDIHNLMVKMGATRDKLSRDSFTKFFADYKNANKPGSAKGGTRVARRPRAAGT